MKKILTEKNLAAVLFVVVMVVFSLAHEDSKERDSHYNTSVIPSSQGSAMILVSKQVNTLSATAHQ